MASIANDPNGLKRIQFMDGGGHRKTIRLGRCAERAAESVRLRVEELQSARLNGHPLSRETSLWLSGIGDELHHRLAKVGLCEPRQAASQCQLGEFIGTYMAQRIDLKPGSLAVMEQARKSLIAYFGAQRSMQSITPADADAWRLSMLGEKLAEATIRKRTQAAKQFVRAAMRQRLLTEDPFADLPSGSRANPQRLRFIDPDTIARIIDACPDAQWKLIVALARYAGVRVPSELLSLKWEHVNWEHNRLAVPSPKTEHHEGKALRVIPLFPELRPHLLEVFEQAAPGAEYVITRYRVGNANLRTQFNRIIGHAGLKPWPKPFHNLRSSRETELAERFPLHVVCGWIGNTAKVAVRHYLQTTAEHFETAVSEPTSVRKGPGRLPTTNNQAFPEAAQKAAQQMHAEGGRQSHRENDESQKVAKYSGLRSNATPDDIPNKNLMGEEGFEPPKALSQQIYSLPRLATSVLSRSTLLSSQYWQPASQCCKSSSLP